MFEGYLKFNTISREVEKFLIRVVWRDQQDLLRANQLMIDRMGSKKLR